MHSHSRFLGAKFFNYWSFFSFFSCYYRIKEQLLWQLVQQPPWLMVVDNKALQWRGWQITTRTPKLHREEEKHESKLINCLWRSRMWEIATQYKLINWIIICHYLRCCKLLLLLVVMDSSSFTMHHRQQLDTNKRFKSFSFHYVVNFQCNK